MLLPITLVACPAPSYKEMLKVMQIHPDSNYMENIDEILSAIRDADNAEDYFNACRAFSKATGKELGHARASKSNKTSNRKA